MSLFSRFLFKLVLLLAASGRFAAPEALAISISPFEREANTTPMAKIYRSTESRFSSGEIAREKLLKATHLKQNQHWAEIQVAGPSSVHISENVSGQIPKRKDESPKSHPKKGESAKTQNRYWVPVSQLLTSLHLSHLARIKEPQFSYEDRSLMSQKKRRWKAGEIVQIHSLQLPWVRIYSPHREKKPGKGQTSEKTWIDWSALAALPSTKGLAISHDRAIMHAGPSPESKVLTLLNPGTQLQILGYKNGWVKTKMGRLRGFILHDQLITPFHLTEKIQVRGTSKWLRASKVHHSGMTTDDGLKFSFENISLIKLSEKRALADPLGTSYFSEPLFDSKIMGEISPHKNLEILTFEKVFWGMAWLKELKNVWWVIKRDQVEKNEIRVTTEDLYQRKIYDMIRAPLQKIDIVTDTLRNDEYIYLTSAQGIFSSFDRKNWNEIKMFGSNNYPLAATDDTIFIGPYLSRDNARSFHPFIRWDRLLNTLSKSYPKKHNLGLGDLKIEKIVPDSLDSKKIQLELTINSKKVVLNTVDQGLSWNVVDGLF